MLDEIKIALRGIEYAGRPLTLGILKKLRHVKLEEFDLEVLCLWLADKFTNPRVMDPDSMSVDPHEAAASVKVILQGSGFLVGEAAAESDLATSTLPGSTVA